MNNQIFLRSDKIRELPNFLINLMPVFFWQYLIIAALAVFAWVRIQRLNLLKYWWVYEAHPLSRDSLVWQYFYLTIAVAVLAILLARKLKLFIAIGLIAAFYLPFFVSQIIYNNHDWHAAFQRGSYEEITYSYFDIFHHAKDSAAVMVLKNFTRFQENRRIQLNKFDFSIDGGSISTHPPGHAIIYGNLGHWIKSNEKNPAVMKRGLNLVQGNVSYYQFIVATIILVLSAFVLTFNLTKSARTGLVAALASGLAPSYILYSSGPNILIAAIFVAVFAALSMIESKRYLTKIFGSILTLTLVGILLLLSFGMLLVIPAIGIFLLFRAIMKKISWRSAIWLFTILILFFYLFMRVLNDFYSYNYLYSYSLAMINQNTISNIFQVSWLDSLDYNIYESWPMFGIPIMILIIWSILQINNNPYWWLALFALLLFFIVDFTGISRGENGRILVFLAPIFTITAVVFFAHQLQLKKYLSVSIILLLLWQIFYFSQFFSIMGFQWIGD